MITEVLRVELEKLAKDFIAKYDELGMRASGEWADSLEVVMDGHKGDLIGLDYTKYLTNGRSPGGLPPIKNLEDWVKVKFGLIAPLIP